MKIWSLIPIECNNQVWRKANISTLFKRYLDNSDRLRIRTETEGRARKIASDTFFNSLVPFHAVSEYERTLYPIPNDNSPFLSPEYTSCVQDGEDDNDDDEGII